MAFLCPACGAAALEITDAIELPADSTWDEIGLQLVACARCGFRGAAVYQESRRGSLDSEVVDHFGYPLPSEALEALHARIAACPTPRNSTCPCDAHLYLSQPAPAGPWSDELKWDNSFAMTFAGN